MTIIPEEGGGEKKEGKEVMVYFKFCFVNYAFNFIVL